MDAGLFVLVFLLALVVLSVVCVMRVRQFGSELARVRDDVDVLRNAVLVNSQICHDIACDDASLPNTKLADTPSDDLQTLLENPLVQQVLDRR